MCALFLDEDEEPDERTDGRIDKQAAGFFGLGACNGTLAVIELLDFGEVLLMKKVATAVGAMVCGNVLTV